MRKLCRQVVLCLVAALVQSACSAIAQSTAPAALPDPVMWRQDTFLIPYQFTTASDPKSAREVVLYVSNDWGRSWREVTRARPDVRFFTYRAEGDGDYCFAMRTIDQAGQSWPAGEQVTELRVVVDTRPPGFQMLQGVLDPQGQVHLLWRATDEHLDPASLKLEIQSEGQVDWQPVAVGTSHAATQNETSGQTACVAPAGARRVLVRATIYDRAGNRGTSSGEALPNTTVPTLSQATPPHVIGDSGWEAAAAARGLAPPSQELTNPFANRVTAPQSQPWPADAHSLAPIAPAHDNPPHVAQLDALRTRPSEPTPPASVPWMESPFHQASSSRARETPMHPQQPATSSQARTISPEARAVNTPHFALDYDVSDVGHWGVAKVELWGTTDSGQTWRSFAVDHDNRSPINVTVPGEGLYGFRIAVEAVGGLTPQAPAPGERPELWVHVDTSQPQAQLLAARQGEGYFADHLEITWQAGDANLADRPIGLYYSSRPNGPWSAAATNLDNTGRYSWRLQRHVPSQVYLRVEARDRAGNVGVHQFDQPISLSVPQASGSLRDLYRP